MHPIDITAAIHKADTSQTKIARSLNPPVTQQCVSQVVYANQSSARVAEAISKAINIPIQKIWPGKYDRYLRLAS